MQINGIPDQIDHETWLDVIASLGFTIDGSIQSIQTVEADTLGQQFGGLRVTTRRGDTVVVPFTYPKSGRGAGVR